jgi:glutathione S-transferase
MPAQPLRVWGIGTSRTMRAHWMLAELRLDYESREILPRTESMEDPEFKSLNHRCKVPVLEHGDLVIGESGAIVFHLADRYRERCVLAPQAGTADRAIFDDLCLYPLMELDAPLYVIRRHGGLPDVYGESPVAVRSAGEYFLRQVSEMDRRLADGRPFLLGEDFSAADLLLVTCLGWARIVELALSPRLEEYLATLSKRDAYLEAFARNFTPEALALMAGARGKDIET